MNDTISFLRLYKYISLYCTVCDGEYDIETAGQAIGTEDWAVQSDTQEDENSRLFNLVCPECQDPHPEVLLKER